MTEKVEHPSHYNFSKIEVIDVIFDWGLDFCLGNVIKYISRAGRKNDEIEDLSKSKFYLDYFLTNWKVKNIHFPIPDNFTVDEVISEWGLDEDLSKIVSLIGRICYVDFPYEIEDSLLEASKILDELIESKKVETNG